MRTFSKTLVAVMVSLGALTTSAYAGRKTASELLAECDQLEKGWANYPIHGDEVPIVNEYAGQCWGYVRAFFELSYTYVPDPNGKATPLLITACPPNNVSVVQYVRMFLQKARNSPAQLHTDAFSMLWGMLIENFPCSK